MRFFDVASKSFGLQMQIGAAIIPFMHIKAFSAPDPGSGIGGRTRRIGVERRVDGDRRRIQRFRLERERAP
jgi:hypothetical protein